MWSLIFEYHDLAPGHFQTWQSRSGKITALYISFNSSFVSVLRLSEDIKECICELLLSVFVLRDAN